MESEHFAWQVAAQRTAVGATNQHHALQVKLQFDAVQVTHDNGLIAIENGLQLGIVSVHAEADGLAVAVDRPQHRGHSRAVGCIHVEHHVAVLQLAQHGDNFRGFGDAKVIQATMGGGQGVERAGSGVHRRSVHGLGAFWQTFNEWFWVEPRANRPGSPATALPNGGFLHRSPKSAA